jgi:ABC-type glycerol-3-phosphate transport system substrate-binding protein
MAIFAVLAIIGLAVFATYRGGSEGGESMGTVTIWGTYPAETMNRTISAADAVTGFEFSGRVTYSEKDPETYDTDLLEAFATGNGPDLFFVSDRSLLKHMNKIRPIPYSNLSKRQFQDTFIEEAELFLGEEGIYATPFSVDPMVMYWNRDILAAEGVAQPPQYWEAFYDLSPRITRRDPSANIQRATVALGEFENIRHASGILSTLIMQSGNEIARRGPGDDMRSVLGRGINVEAASQQSNAASNAVRFYTEFSNPVKSVYSWNRSMPNSRRAFTSGDLAFYFGRASEVSYIRQANPNLNFAVAPMPQIRENDEKMVHGRIRGLAIAQSSDNPQGAIQAAFTLMRQPLVKTFAQNTNLPPVRRDLLAEKPSDNAAQSVFYDAALIADGWLHPDTQQADGIFKTMVQDITAGRRTVAEAVGNAANRLANIY